MNASIFVPPSTAFWADTLTVRAGLATLSALVLEAVGL
jgi:hypothetical protein